MRVALMHMGLRRTVDQEAEQFRAAVVTARVHQALALVDDPEIEIGDDLAFARSQRCADEFTLWRDDCGEATTGDRLDSAAGVLHDPGLLLGIQPGCRTDYETSGLQRVLADIDRDLLGEAVSGERAGIH